MATLRSPPHNHRCLFRNPLNCKMGKLIEVCGFHENLLICGERFVVIVLVSLARMTGFKEHAAELVGWPSGRLAVTKTNQPRIRFCQSNGCAPSEEVQRKELQRGFQRERLLNASNGKSMFRQMHYIVGAE